MTSPAGATDSRRSEYLHRDSFIERSARSRAFALLDDQGASELLDPFCHVESPWLESQGVVPQSDDGVVIVQGTVCGQGVVVIAIEQAFQGGGIGEVSGAKVVSALALALRETGTGRKTAAILLLETGGVRLQEANLGLAAIAEACAGVLELRGLQPVVAVIAGGLGSFGGMSIVAALCSTVIMTREARLGLNGPEVLESEGGIEEFDSADHALVWSIHGGVQRHALGQADALVHDVTSELRDAVAEALRAGAVPSPASRDLVRLRAHLSAIDPTSPPDPGDLPAIFAVVPGEGASSHARTAPTPGRVVGTDSRGRRWTVALGDAAPFPVESTLLEAPIDLDGTPGVLLTVVPDPSNPFRRVRNGEVGLVEGLALAERITRILQEDAVVATERKRPIISIVDFPSQAYGRLEEMVGIHLYLAAATDAYATARTAGHPTVALVVGTALSGGFLAHGLQANQILAIDDPAVEIHAMHKPAAARITRRTVSELDDLAARIPPLSYNVRDWASLGLCDALIALSDADRPSPHDVSIIRTHLQDAVQRARQSVTTLERRWSAAASGSNRAATRRVWETMAEQWT